MNTRLGKFIGTNCFGKLFFAFSLAIILCAACINGLAIGRLWDNSWLPAAVGLLYAAAGLLVLTQKEATKRWTSRRFGVFLGFSTCFFIYDAPLLLLWKICAAIAQFSEKTDAAGVLCADALAIITVAGGFLHTKSVKCRSYSIPVGQSGMGCRIALCSDIHLGAFVREKHVRRIVEKINELEADLVVICGDIIDAGNQILSDAGALAKISAEFQKISSKEGVFAVLGNHDPQAENAAFLRFLQDAHIRLLHNQSIRLSKINLIGRTNASNNRRLPLEDFADKIEPSMPVVILDHDPCGIPEAAQFGADLVLCGHTHRGQFFPISYFTKWANGRHFFYGHEQFGKTHAVISSGAGFFQLPIRIGTDNEIADIRLTQ